MDVSYLIVSEEQKRGETSCIDTRSQRGASTEDRAHGVAMRVTMAVEMECYVEMEERNAQLRRNK